MFQYTVSAKILSEMAPAHRVVQAAIAIIANRQFGIDQPPRGIKYEGGVIVNRREIAIKRGYVTDDYRRSNDPTPEEKAVVYAIRDVVRLWKEGGAAALASYGAVPMALPMGDPLRSMFG